MCFTYYYTYWSLESFNHTLLHTDTAIIRADAMNIDINADLRRCRPIILLWQCWASTENIKILCRTKSV